MRSKWGTGWSWVRMTKRGMATCWRCSRQGRHFRAAQVPLVHAVFRELGEVAPQRTGAEPVRVGRRDQRRGPKQASPRQPVAPPEVHVVAGPHHGENFAAWLQDTIQLRGY